ncbi:MAG: HAD family phosphatase [Candidatus Thermoplasmatota archaeon]|jgi:putative hydrolase of the HAD superfamily|nr:HAD family phosphatase [Candidatus Thermoplasmatota archaeon]MCL5983398.1 HAD family phosphatase [Candidatus Thermoplasmatota archaeon]
MSRISLLLWDVGGVLLSNAWDRDARAAAAGRFGLDRTEFERRHALVEEDFETGRMDWEGYLDATVFYVPRRFSREEFRQFMRAQSTANPDAIALARSLREQRSYVMATLNNESRELNDYRIHAFGLRDLFDGFFSSGYTGRRKPAPEAYRLALDVTQRTPEESLLLDDRRENIEAAARLGLHTLMVQDTGRLREELARMGVRSG